VCEMPELLIFKSNLVPSSSKSTWKGWTVTGQTDGHRVGGRTDTGWGTDCDGNYRHSENDVTNYLKQSRREITG
jgi:hypothetical protein